MVRRIIFEWVFRRLTLKAIPPIIHFMKRVLLIIGFLILAAGVRVPPCSAVGGMTMDCCPTPSAVIAAPFTACCKEERAAAPAAALTKALPSGATAQPLMTVAAMSVNISSPFSKPVSLHEIGPPKNPTYIIFSTLLL